MKLLTAWAFLAASSGLLADSISPTITGEIYLTAQPNTAAYTGGITWGGLFNGYDGGYDAGSGPGPVTGTASFTNAGNNSTSNVSVSGSTNGTLSSTLTLGSQAVMNVTNAAPGVYSADSYGEFSDSLDVSGLQAEKPYIYDFDFDIDGTTSATGGGRAFVYVYVEITDYVGNDAVVTDTWWSSYTGDAAISTGSPANVSGGPLTYEKFNPSDTAVLTVLVRSYADDTQGGGFSGAVGGDMASNANFLNTLTLTGASLEDSSGSVIPGSSIADTSGFVFSDVGSAPEPGTLSLLVISALFLGAVTLLRRLRSA